MNTKSLLAQLFAGKQNQKASVTSDAVRQVTPIAVFTVLVAEALSQEAMAKRLGLNGSQTVVVDSDPKHKVVIESGPKHGNAYVSNGSIVYKHDGSGQRDSLCFSVQDENGYTIKSGCGKEMSIAGDSGSMGMLGLIAALALGGAAGLGGGGGSTPGPVARPAFTHASDWTDIEDLDPDRLEVTDDLSDALTGDDLVFLPSTGSTPPGYNPADPFVADGGNDSIYGNDIDDIILGGDGNDLLRGGSGNDTITPGLGNDTIIGGEGDDVYIHEGDRTQFRISGVGEDSEGNLLISVVDIDNLAPIPPADGVNQGSDLYAIDPTEVTGEDTLSFDDADLAIFIGGSTDDAIVSGGGDNLMLGGPGDDTLTGGGGNDVIIGDEGNDTITGGGGADILDGRSGRDTVSYDGEIADIYVNLDTDGSGTQEARSITYVGNSEVTDTEANNSLGTAQSVNAMADWGVDFDPDIFMSTMVPHITIDSPAGSNPGGDFDYYTFTVDPFPAGVTTVNGYFDIDSADFDARIFLYKPDGTLLAQNDDNGSDIDSGGSTEQNSFLEYRFQDPGTYIIGVGEFGASDSGGSGIMGTTIPGGATYRLHLSLEHHPVDPGNGFTMGPLLDTIENFEGIIGGDGDDILKGDSVDNHIRGRGGVDKIYGFSGNDTLEGEKGDDFLYAGEGRDSLLGGDDDDLLVGGLGHDTLQGGDNDDHLFGDDVSGVVNSAKPAFHQVVTYGNDTVDGDDGINVLHGDVMDSTLNLPEDLNFVTRNFGHDYIVTNIGSGATASQLFGDANDMTSFIDGSSGIYNFEFGSDTLMSTDSGTLDDHYGDARVADVYMNGNSNTLDFTFGDDSITDAGELGFLYGDALSAVWDIMGDDNEVQYIFGDDAVIAGTTGTLTSGYLDIEYSDFNILGDRNQGLMIFGDDSFSGTDVHIYGDASQQFGTIGGSDNSLQVFTGQDVLDDTAGIGITPTVSIGDIRYITLTAGGDRNSIEYHFANDEINDSGSTGYGELETFSLTLDSTAMDGNYNFYLGNDTLTDSGQGSTFMGDGSDFLVALDAVSTGNTVMLAFGNDRLIGADMSDGLFGDFDTFTFADDGTNTTSITFGNDTIMGNDGADTLYGEGRQINITGVDEIICGNDVIYGGSGNDLIYGDEDETASATPAVGLDGHDTLMGEDGDDTIFGGKGNDSIEGGDGVDSIEGSFGDDYLDLGGPMGAGAVAGQVVKGDAGNDHIIGGYGVQGSGMITIDGGDDIDTLDYSNDSRVLFIDMNTGETRYDVPATGVHTESEPNSYSSPDMLDPDEFNTLQNSIIANSQSIPHISIAGTGDNTFDYFGFTITAADIAAFNNSITVQIDMDHAMPSWDPYLYLYSPSGSRIGRNDDAHPTDPGSVHPWDSRINIELSGGNLMAGTYVIGLGRYYTSGASSTGGSDPLSGNVIPNGKTYTMHVSYDHVIDPFATTSLLEEFTDIENILGSEQSDKIIGDGFANEIDGNGGTDSIDGGAGDDLLRGGDGADTINGQGDNDNIEGNNEADVLNGDAGNDTIDGGADADTIDGGADADTLSGGSGADSIEGGTGNDEINGDGGADILKGESGDDIINGGSGADSLTGGTGNDTLNGGGDADYFIYNNANEGSDVINGFSAGTDKVALTGGNDIDGSPMVVGGDTMLTLDSGTTILIVGVTEFSIENDLTFI